MNIGDKVRNIHGREEGVIIKFLSAGQVEVEIEDGFRLPFMMSQLVVVASAEKEFFKPAPVTSRNMLDELQKSTAPKPEVHAAQGVFLAFTHKNDQELELFAINNTDFDLLFTLGEEYEGKYTGIASGQLGKRSKQKVHEMTLAKFERWPALVVQALRFRTGPHSPLEPLLKKMRFKAAQFYRNQQDAPLINKKAYLFQLDEADPKPLETKTWEASELKNALLENQGKVGELPSKNEAKAKPATEVDLHIEKLMTNAKGLNNAQIIEIQLNAFEKALDKAIQAGANEIVFIHGVGNGVLKLELQRRLSRHPNVHFFQDAKKEKFGYGATMAVIK